MAHEEGGSSIFTYLLLGVGGYLLWNWYSSSQTPVVSTTTTPGLPAGGTTTATSLSTTGINSTTGTSTTTVANNPVTANMSSPAAQSFISAMTTTLAKYGDTAGSYSGFQWDYIAKLAFPSQYYLSLSKIGIVGQNSYTLNQYMQAYLNGLATMFSTIGLSGLGCAGCGNPNCSSCAYGMGAVSNTNLFYSKMANRRGFAVGDFGTSHANKSESGWVN